MFKNEKKTTASAKTGTFFTCPQILQSVMRKKGSSHLHQSLLSNKEKLRRLCKNDIVEFVLNLIETFFLFQTVQS